MSASSTYVFLKSDTLALVPDPKVKGVAFRTVLALVERARGAAIVERALAAMPSELASAVRYGELIAAGWYPVAWYRAMWRELLAATGEGDAFVRQVGRDSIDRDFGSVYRVLMRMLRPWTLVSVGVKHFGQIYDTGSVAVEVPSNGKLRLRFTGCLEFDHTMWIEVLGSCERLAELAGGRGASSAIVEGGHDGMDACLAVLQWR